MSSLQSEKIYETFLREVLPEMNENVALGIRRRMWFQFYGAPVHFHRSACHIIPEHRLSK